MHEIWFWQRIISPHMAGLAVALVRQGCRVTYVAEAAMSADRASQGWTTPVLTGVELKYATNSLSIKELARNAPEDAVHICQGIRSNGLISIAQRELAMRCARQWVVMETVNDAVWYGALKRTEYSRLFNAFGARLQGVLATGHSTTDWVAARGFTANSVFPFAYFLPDNAGFFPSEPHTTKPFRFVFAGQLIARKRVDWLFEAFCSHTHQEFEIRIVGNGPDEPGLRALAERTLGNRVSWLGQLPLSEVPRVMTQADCLVLPSIHDGWGAVASESLMVGTPVVCSDACGVAGVVQASAVGGVFPVKDKLALTQLLAAQLAQGTVSREKRRQIADWATCLGAASGAAYLQEILNFKATNQGARPVVPWLRESR